MRVAPVQHQVQDHDRLIREAADLLCRPEPRLAEAEAMLTGGPVQDGPGAPLSALLTDVQDVEWWRLEEAALDDDPAAGVPRTAAAWSAVHALGQEVLLAVGADDVGLAGVSVGVRRGSPAATHWRAGLAPDLLWVRTEAPAGWTAVTGRHEERVAAPRPAPPQESVTARDRALPSALGRLLALPVAGWCAVVRLRPRGPERLADLRLEVAGLREVVAAQLTRSVASTETVSGSVTSPLAESAGRVLSAWADMLDDAGEVGAWSVAVHLCAVSGPVLAAAQTAWSGLLSPHCSGTPVTRTQRWDWTGCALGAPEVLGWLSSSDLAALLVVPQEAVGAVQVRRRLPGGRRARGGERPLHLGTWLGTDLPAAVDVDDLSGHALVTGITGSGKSTTTATLLQQLWNVHRVPFLVLDPVKADYESLASLLDGGLRVLSARELSLNVLQAWPGRPVDRHVSTVGAAFRGAFSLPVPVPFVASLLFEELAVEALAGARVDLHDAAARLDSLVSELGYQGEIEGNIRASLGLRLRLLLQPTRAEVVAGTGSLDWLLEHPTLVRLSDVGDDEERAFLTAVLVLLVAEGARARGTTPGVVHVTVVEEAHRLMPEPRHTGNEDGDSANVSATLMTQLLAEIRSYGESVVVVDQSPAAVAREALRNTNLKLAHRAVDAADQESLGSALGLTPEEHGALGSLGVGRCLVSSRHLVRPQTADVTPPEPDGTPVFAPVDVPAARRCCRGTPSPHHASQALGAAAELAVATWAMSSEPGRWLRERLAPHVRADPRLRVACLMSAGVRRHVTTLRRLGHLDRSRLDAHEEALWAAAVGDRPPPAHPGTDRPGPYAACVLCPAPCTARAVVASGGLRGTSGLRARLAQLDSDPAVVAALAFGVDAVTELALDPSSTTAALVTCIAATTTAERGLQQALVTELRAADGGS